MTEESGTAVEPFPDRGGWTMWTVERGAYSDHRVMCLCPTEDGAKAIAKAYNASEDAYQEARVGTLPVVTEPRRITTYSLVVNIWDDGTTTDEAEDIRTEWEFDMLWPNDYAPATWRWVRAPVHKDMGGRLNVQGTDLERVRRVFSDRRAQLLAEDALRMKSERRG